MVNPEDQMDWLDIELFAHTEPPAVPWIVESFCAAGQVTMLVGDPGVGKSWVALGAASAAALGTPFLGMHTQPRSSVLIDAENGPMEMHRRLKALKFFESIKVADIQPGFDFEHSLDYLADACAPAHCGILILDSMRTIWGGDENESKAVTNCLTQLQQLARTANIAIVVIHHTNKMGTFRGSGALQAVPETMVTCGRLKRDKLTNRFYMRWDKLRSMPRPATKWALLEKGIVVPAHKPAPDELWPVDLG